MLELTPVETALLLGKMPKKAMPKAGRKPSLKNYDMATRVMFGVEATVKGVKKTADRAVEVETLSGDMVPTRPSLPTVANARDGKIGNRQDKDLREQVEEGLRRVEELGVDRLTNCLEMVSEEELEELSAREKVGMGVHIATILDKVGKRTGAKESSGVVMNFYVPQEQKNIMDYGDVITVEGE